MSLQTNSQWLSITFKLQFTTTILPNLTDRVFNYNSTTSHNNDYITSHNCNKITITDYSQIALLNHTSTAVIAIRLCYSQRTIFKCCCLVAFFIRLHRFIEVKLLFVQPLPERIMFWYRNCIQCRRALSMYFRLLCRNSSVNISVFHSRM